MTNVQKTLNPHMSSSDHSRVKRHISGVRDAAVSLRDRKRHRIDAFEAQVAAQFKQLSTTIGRYVACNNPELERKCMDALYDCAQNVIEVCHDQLEKYVRIHLREILC